MTRDELLKLLQRIGQEGIEPEGKYEESDHIAADNALLNFINDAEITEAFLSIKKWYS